jgi:hypothetical protein
MIEENKKPSFWGGPPAPCFRDTETGLEYRRILGGMAWPDTQPGFVVIAGEDFESDKKTGEHQIRIIAEYEGLNPSDLIRRAGEYKGIFKADGIYGCTDNRPMMDFIYNGKVDLFLSDAPFMDEESKAVQYYLLLIREMTSATKKILSYGENSKLPGILSGVDQHSVLPAVLALGYVLAVFRSSSPRDPNEHLLVQPEPVPTY